MGGNVGADGMTCGVQMLNTERVPNVKEVEDALIFSEIDGRRSWEQVLRGIIAEVYKYKGTQLDQMVHLSLLALKNNRVPICVMDRYRYDQRFNSIAALK
jgi:hypothetical protein